MDLTETSQFPIASGRPTPSAVQVPDQGGPPFRPPLRPPFQSPPQQMGRPTWQPHPFQHLPPYQQPWMAHWRPFVAPQMRPVSSAPIPGTHWMEVRTNTGGMYWHNQSTGQSTWEKPPEVVVPPNTSREPEGSRPLDPAKAAMLARARASGATVAPQYAGDSNVARGRDAEQDDVDEDDVFFTEEDIAGEEEKSDPSTLAAQKQGSTSPKALAEAEASRRIDPVAAFEELLREKGVNGFSRYERELPKLQPDPRFKSLPASQRRQIFEKYCARAGQEAKKRADHPVTARSVAARSAEEKLAEDAFRALLQECVTRSSVSWKHVEGELLKDPRATGVPAERRESLFLAHRGVLQRVEDARERADRRAKYEMHAAEERQRHAGEADALMNFRTLLAEAVHDARESWTECLPRLQQDPQGRALHPLLDKLAAENLFREHVAKLEKLENRNGDAELERESKRARTDGVGNL